MTGKHLPIYVMPEMRKNGVVEGIAWLQKRAGVRTRLLSRFEFKLIPIFFFQTNYNFQFYDLPVFFHTVLKAANSDALPTVAVAEAELSRDVFLYTPGVSCKYAPKF